MNQFTFHFQSNRKPTPLAKLSTRGNNLLLCLVLTVEVAQTGNCIKTLPLASIPFSYPSLILHYSRILSSYHMPNRSTAATGSSTSRPIFNTPSSNMGDFSHRQDKATTLGLYKEDLDRFGKILRTINLDKIPEFASNIRQYGHHSMGKETTAALPEPFPISCKVIEPPLCGSYHIVFPIEFVDGMKWMLKVSVNGDHFNSVTAAALASEAQTMQMLKKETSIPVPAVYAFDISSDNTLSIPFILMEKLEGRPLNYLWFNKETPKASLEHFRVKTLQGLARLMVQLNKFTVKSSGSPVFRSDGTPIGLSGAKAVDHVAEFNKATAFQAPRQHGDKDGDKDPDSISIKEADSDALKTSGDSSNEDDIIYEKGPFSDPKAYFLSNLDRPDPANRADAYERGTDMCLRLFIEWAFGNTQDHDRRFVLTHPDLDLQNILVADDGTITGLIDWDGVAAVPREVGCAQYPLWLMRDWVPSRYDYDIESGELISDTGYQESPPAELATYRALYAQFMEVEIVKMTRGSSSSTTFETLAMHEAKLTRQSLIMRHLDLSAGDPWAALGTVNHIIDHIEVITASDWKEDDSDIDSFSSCSSTSDSDSVINCDIGEEEEQIGVPHNNEHRLGGKSDDVSSYHTSPEIEELERLQCQKESLGVEAEGNRGSPIPSGPSQKDVKELEPQKLTKTESSAPGWMRRLLQLGFDTAESSLRRLASIGYVLDEAVGQLTDALAETEAHDGEVVEAENCGHVVEPNNLKGKAATEPFEPCGTEPDKNSSSVQNPVAQDQLDNVQSEEPIAELSRGSRVGVALKSLQAHAISNIEPQKIPVRKAELLEKARAEKRAEEKALYRADKAAIKKELKVWEHIALAVWVRGVSLEQLKNNQFRIARWVVETLQTEQENGGSLDVNAVSPSVAGATAEGSEAVESSAVDDETTQSRQEADETFEKEVAGQTKKVKELDPLSRPPATFGPRLPTTRAKAPSSLRALWKSGVSYIKQMLYNRNEVEEDMRCQSPESSASSGSDKEDGESDFGGARSSATSLSDGEGEVNETEEANLSKKSKTEKANPKNEDARAKAKKDTCLGTLGGDTDGEDNNDDSAGEDEGHKSSTIPELPEFIDHGGFDRYTVCNLLGRGELDELRMLRLKDGFLQLLERY